MTCGEVISREDALELAAEAAVRQTPELSPAATPHNLMAHLMSLGTYQDPYYGGQLQGNPSLLLWLVQMEGGPDASRRYAIVALDASMGAALGFDARDEVLFPVSQGDTDRKYKPITPLRLRTSTVEGDRPAVRLSWVDVAQNEAEYVVERSTVSAEGPWVVVAVLPQDSTSFVDEGLFENGIYLYRVKARNGAGDFGYTGVVGVALGAGNELPVLATPTSTRVDVPQLSDCRQKLSELERWIDGFSYYNPGNQYYQTQMGFRPRRGVRLDAEALLATLGIPRAAVDLKIGCGNGGQPSQPFLVPQDPLFRSLVGMLEVPAETKAGKPIPLKLRVKNAGTQPVRIEYGEPRDFVVTRPDGSPVWYSMCGVVWPLVLYTKTLEPGEEMVVEGVWDQADDSSEGVAPGKYLVSGFLRVGYDKGQLAVQGGPVTVTILP
ncbi:MAG: BsuPI-related putative proteinase inhibitor [Chloroflexota bacterium]|nr:BsuPI-related putative proteinase inhibitor [Chloroflexota bacterium]